MLCMSKYAQTRLIWLIPLILMSAAAVLFLVIPIAANIITAPPREYRAIEVGMREEPVKQLLGEPWMDSSEASAHRDFRDLGYEYPLREVSHKVLVYIEGDNALYVYISLEGLVEYVYLGKS